MPSPFPGMDPYLEDPQVWRGVHHYLITYTAEALNASLPAGYIANIEERIVVVEPRQDLYPDVHVFKGRRSSSARSRHEKAQAVLEQPAMGDPPLVLSLEPFELTEAYIDIRKAGREKQLVTTIEVLSPTNKTSGNSAREQYLHKQEKVLKSRIHLLEIDLLRQGAFTVAAPLALLEDLTNWDYIICLRRGGQPHCEVWPALLSERLPRVRVPLQGRDPDVLLDLQGVFERCYDLGKYAEQLDYQQEPAVSLPAHYKTWADDLLRDQGFRPRRRRPRRNGGRS